MGQSRKVNPYLDKQPKIGPFPADQIVPWSIIIGVSYYLFKVFLGLNWVWTGMLAAWGIATWWILTASKGWRFLSKFVPVPFWVRGYGRYKRFLEINNDYNKTKKS